jgi:hypothetical protein
LRRAAAPLQVRIGYLGYRPDPGPLLSNVIPEPPMPGCAVPNWRLSTATAPGASSTSSYSLTSATVDSPEALLQAARPSMTKACACSW